jgi:hypothetical protein
MSRISTRESSAFLNVRLTTADINAVFKRYAGCSSYTRPINQDEPYAIPRSQRIWSSATTCTYCALKHCKFTLCSTYPSRAPAGQYPEDWYTLRIPDIRV